MRRRILRGVNGQTYYKRAVDLSLHVPIFSDPFGTIPPFFTIQPKKKKKNYSRLSRCRVKVQIESAFVSVNDTCLKHREKTKREKKGKGNNGRVKFSQFVLTGFNSSTGFPQGSWKNGEIEVERCAIAQFAARKRWKVWYRRRISLYFSLFFSISLFFAYVRAKCIQGRDLAARTYKTCRCLRLSNVRQRDDSAAASFQSRASRETTSRGTDIQVFVLAICVFRTRESNVARSWSVTNGPSSVAFQMQAWYSARGCECFEERKKDWDGVLRGGEEATVEGLL